VSEDLRLNVKWDGLAIFVGVVIRVSRKNVRVGSAQPNRANSHQNFVRTNSRHRNIAYLEIFDA
jgi:hypothetical protein